MAQVTRARSVFGDRLRAELERQDLSIRKLSRRINPAKPEASRRALAKWIAGDVKPTQANRILVADALGVSHDFFDEDDEEESEVAEIVQVLMSRIDRVVHEQVTEALAAALATGSGDAS
jgi:transcriptional regulator with XRE-family HTH domain